MTRLMLGVASSLLGLVIFVVAMHVHFPSTAVVERARWEVQHGSDGAYAFEATGASWWMPGGVTFEDATLLSIDQKRRSKPGEDAGKTGSPLFRADSMSARLALLPLLQGTQIIQYAAAVYGGELTGEFGESETHRLITVHTDGLDLTRIPIEGDDWSVDARGMLRIDADLSLATARGKGAPDSEGSILVEIDDFVIENSTMMGMDLVAAEFNEAVLELEMKGKKAEVKRGRFESDLIDLTIGGNVNMAASDPDRWRLRIELMFTLGESLDTMASMLPQLKRARGEDGTYHMICSGTWGNPTCREDRSKVRGERPARANIGRSRPDRGDDDKARENRRRKRSDDAEKRRDERRQRLEERRNRLRDDRDDDGMDRDDGPENFDDRPEMDRDFDRPLGRPLPIGPRDQLDLPDGAPEFDDDFGQPEFDEGLEPPDDLPDLGYIDE